MTDTNQQVPFSTWSFDRSLRLTPEASAAEIDGRTADFPEEVVETLIAFNLDRFFPGLQLAPVGFSGLHGWQLADVAAVDPTGCRHLFEIKFGTSARDAHVQLLAYAMRFATYTDARWAKLPDPIDVEAIGRRVVGAWTGNRTSNATKKKLQAWTAAARDMGDLAGVSQAIADRLAAARRIVPEGSKARRQIHLHLVAPEFPGRVLRAARTLRDRGVRISCWEVRAARRDGGGLLALRRAPGSVADGCADPDDLCDVMVQMALQDQAWVSNRSWTYNSSESRSGEFGFCAWLGNGLFTPLYRHEGRLTIKPWFSGDPSAAGSWARRSRDGLAAWLAAVSGTKPVRGTSWTTSFHGAPVTCRLSGPGKEAEVAFPAGLEPSEEGRLAVLALQALEAAVAAAHEN